MRKRGYTLVEVAVAATLGMTLIAIAFIIYRVLLEGSEGFKGRDERAVEVLERIADAEERKAKSLESIERWVWEPDKRARLRQENPR